MLTPLTFSKTRLLIQTRRSLKRIDSCIHALIGIKEGTDYPDIDQLSYDIKQGFISAMDDDLNFPRALVDIFNIIKKINILIKDRQISSDNAGVLLSAFASVDDVIKIFDFKPKELDPGLHELLKKREAARNAGDFEKADQIREELRALGVDVQDLKI